MEQETSPLYIGGRGQEQHTDATEKQVNIYIILYITVYMYNK